MKTKLLFGIMICLTISIHSQNVWTGTEDDLWSNENNWSGSVPTATEDVLIPSGFTVTLDTPANIRSIEVQGNSILNVTESLIIAVDSEFEDNVVVNWSGGDLGGGGILLNSGTINMSFFSFDISGSTVLNNPGTINMVGGAILISSDSVLNNSGTGIIDFKINGSQFGATSGDLINFGTIKTSFPNPTDQGFIACDIINQDGIYQIDSGTLSLNNTVVNLMGAEFNILAGATLNLNSPMTVQGVLTGNVFGDLNWSNDMSVGQNAVFDFQGNNTINWVSGDLIGGGTITNTTIINRNGGGNTFIGEESTLLNNGELNLTSGADIFIETNSTLENSMSGIIDIQTNGADISSTGSAPNILNNSGLIKVSFQDPTDQSIFSAQLNNNNGTIQVDSGTLWLFNEDTTLTDGFYNVAGSAHLRWTQPITISGALNGNLEGTLEWRGDLIVPSAASFNFSGNGSVEWQTSLLTGGGTLTNEHTISTVSGSNKIIDGATTLINNDEFKSSGFVRVGTNATLTNSATGTIDIETFGSSFGTINSAPHTFINSGLLVASFPANSTVISAPINNFGIIEVTEAEIDFTNTLINETSGLIRGAGTIDLPNNPGDFINNGTFSPGLSPGTLSVLGDYSSTSSSILNIELDGLTQGSDYDLLAVNGNADLNGDIQISLGFNPGVNDEFIIATVSGSINTCNLPSIVMATFGGFDYEFGFNCGNNNELVLTVTSILSIEDNDLNSFIVYPNPSADFINIKNISSFNAELYDINGRRILHSNLDKISIQHLKSGVYLLRIEDENNRTTTRKIIKH